MTGTGVGEALGCGAGRILTGAGGGALAPADAAPRASTAQASTATGASGLILAIR